MTMTTIGNAFSQGWRRFGELTKQLRVNECANQQPMTEDNVWMRWFWLWHVIFYSVLILTSFRHIFGQSDGVEYLLGSSGRAIVIGLAVSIGVWHGLYIRVWQSWMMNRVWLLWGILAVEWVLWLTLSFFDPYYKWMLFAIYPLMYVSLPLRFAVPSAITMYSLLTYLEVEYKGWNQGVEVIGSWATVIGGVLMAVFISATVNQSEERKQLILELERTRDELAKAERQAGILDERQRLSHEIHDTLAQSFVSVITHLEAVEALRSPMPDGLRHHLMQAQSQAREGLTEARRLVWALRPKALEQAPLHDVLKNLSGRWSQSSGIATHNTVTGQPYPLKPNVEFTLLRVAQEALANVSKHAYADQVNITLSYMENMIALDVQDNGHGFDPDTLPVFRVDGGVGLRSMKERVSALGGDVAIESTLGEGTTIAVVLPVTFVGETDLASLREVG